MAFDLSFLPETLAPWVSDIAERLQCPPDYVGSLRGDCARLIDWPPCWHQATGDDGLDRIPEPVGLRSIGSPGMMKSPAMQAALAPCIIWKPRLPATTKLRVKLTSQYLNAFKLRQKVRGHS